MNSRTLGYWKSRRHYFAAGPGGGSGKMSGGLFGGGWKDEVNFCVMKCYKSVKSDIIC